MASVSGVLGATQNGSPVLTPDSVLSLEWHGEERISDYPVQNGQFVSYNKVKVPFDLRMVMTCQGLNVVQSALQPVTQAINQALSNIGLAYGQPMTRDAFLRQLDTMLDSTDLYDVVTPDKVYSNVNLVAYNHVKKHDEGGTLIIAELMFREVRESVIVGYATAARGAILGSNSETAATPVNLGTVLGAPLQPDDFAPPLPPST